jgi:hypothetical protein
MSASDSYIASCLTLRRSPLDGEAKTIRPFAGPLAALLVRCKGRGHLPPCDKGLSIQAAEARSRRRETVDEFHPEYRLRLPAWGLALVVVFCKKCTFGRWGRGTLAREDAKTEDMAIMPCFPV